MPLKRVPAIVSPALLSVLARAGHGDDLVIADANFPAESVARSCGAELVRADGTDATSVLRAVLELVPLDTFAAAQAAVMRQVDQPDVDADAVVDFVRVLSHAFRADGLSGDVAVDRLERFAFYERAKKAFAIVVTSEPRLYGNVIVKKGVVDADGTTKDAKRADAASPAKKART